MVLFYKWPVGPQVFYQSAHSFALVNLKPLVPGHVLVVPKRTSVLRFGDLSVEESHDFIDAMQTVQRLVTHVFKADSLNIAIQDGPELGQLVPHLHTHIIPRFKSDGYGDDIYGKIEGQDLDAAYRDFFKRREAKGSIEAGERHVRSTAEMAAEADMLRRELEKLK